jgi:glycine cleavage system H protein
LVDQAVVDRTVVDRAIADRGPGGLGNGRGNPWTVRVGSAGMNVPDDLRYSSDHEWVRPAGERVRIGITDYAQDALGDVVFVDLPAVGASVDAGGTLGEVESTKSVSEVYAPISGEIVSVNAELAGAPERLNEDPYGEGWICEIVPTEASAVDALLDAEAYRQLTAD